MPLDPQRALAALRFLLRSSHLARADDLPVLIAGAGSHLGAEVAILYLADYDQVYLVPLAATGQPAAAEPIVIDGTLAGRAYSDVVQHLSATADRPTLWSPVLNGTERLGVLQLTFAAGTEVGDELRIAASDVAALAAELIMTRALYGDAIERTRRAQPMTVPAELQWRLLPPLTFVAPRISIAGTLAPTHEVAGDTFDYAVNGDIAHIAIMDAMGHGLEATLLASVATAALRNCRRSGLDLAASVAVMDAEIETHFGPDKFVTGIIGEVDVATGWWRWTTCGHYAALVIRRGRVVKELNQVTGAPLGLGLLAVNVEIGSERLEPGDRLLFYTDGVIEARDSAGEFFGTERLVSFLTTQEAAARPAAETLRRLNQAILAHQDGRLQDDATTLMVEWLGDQAALSTP